MKFEIGQTVIHPHHGPAVVTNVLSRTLKGKQVDYVELEVLANQLVVSLPTSKAEEIGIRDVAGARELDRLAEVLTAPTTDEESQWSRRYKANRASISTGDPMQLATVVRDLVRRRERSSLSLGEKDLLKEAAAPLLAEIALAVHITEEEAQQIMFTMIMEESRAVLDAAAARQGQPA